MRNAALTAFAAIAIAACDDDMLAPGDVAGVYVLESVAGVPLPAIYRQHPYHADTIHIVVAFADTLTFFANGRGIWGGSHYPVSLVHSNGSTGLFDGYTVPYGFSYEIRDGVIYFQPDPPVLPLHSRTTSDAARMLIVPPDKPDFLSYVQFYFKATYLGSALTVDDVTSTEVVLTPGRRRVFRRIN